jgi:hypothetical protein
VDVNSRCHAIVATTLAIYCQSFLDLPCEFSSSGLSRLLWKRFTKETRLIDRSNLSEIPWILRHKLKSIPTPVGTVLFYKSLFNTPRETGDFRQLLKILELFISRINSATDA